MLFMGSYILVMYSVGRFDLVIVVDLKEGNAVVLQVTFTKISGGNRDVNLV